MTGQKQQVNYFLEASPEERARLDAILRDAAVLRKIWFSGPTAHSCVSSCTADNAMRDKEPDRDSQVEGAARPHTQSEAGTDY